MIVHIGNIDATRPTSREMLDKLLKLRVLIKETLPTIRSDNGEAVLTIANPCNYLNIYILYKSNITSKHLGLQSLHLNKAVSSKALLMVFGTLK